MMRRTAHTLYVAFSLACFSGGAPAKEPVPTDILPPSSLSHPGDDVQIDSHNLMDRSELRIVANLVTGEITRTDTQHLIYENGFDSIEKHRVLSADQLMKLKNFASSAIASGFMSKRCIEQYKAEARLNLVHSTPPHLDGYAEIVLHLGGKEGMARDDNCETPEVQALWTATLDAAQDATNPAHK